MKLTFATYEHTCIGFPKVKMKFTFDGLNYVWPYLTVDGVMQHWGWEHSLVKVPTGQIERELKRFDDWVRKTYADKPEYQG